MYELSSSSRVITLAAVVLADADVVCPQITANRCRAFVSIAVDRADDVESVEDDGRENVVICQFLSLL